MKHSKFTGLLVAIVVFTIFGTTLFGQTKYGDEFLVNTTTINIEMYPSIAMDASGNFIVVWESYILSGTSKDDIFAQRYSSDGTPIGSEFMVNDYYEDYQRFPSVAMNNSGRFVVVWQSINQVSGTSDYDIYAQIFDASGNTVGSEILVNTYTDTAQTTPDVAIDNNGNFIVVWQSFNQTADTSGFDIYAQRFDNVGNKVGTEFMVNTYTTTTPMTYYRWMPKIGIAPDGKFTVVWQSWLQDGEEHGIYAQRYSQSGAKMGSEFRVNSQTTSSQKSPDIDVDGKGNIIIVFDNDHEIYGQRYDSTGATIGSNFEINTYTTDYQQIPAVNADSHGNFVATWQSQYQDGSWTGVFGQRFDSLGTALGTEFMVNTYTDSLQEETDVAMFDRGDFVSVWQSEGQDGAYFGIYGQVFKMAPYVANPIADVPVLEDADDTVIDLSSVFADLDYDDALITKAVLSNSNPTLVSTNLITNTLTLDYQPDQSGVASIIIQGTSNGRTANDTFQVTVTAVDDPPVVTNPLLDVDVDEDADDSVIDLSNVFSDVDNDDSAITKAVFSNSNSTLVSAVVAGDDLTLDYQPDQSGTSTVIIQGTSNGKTANDTILVTVTAFDDPPYVANAISDVNVNEDAADTKIALGAVFSDVDNDDALITKSVFSNDNETLVLATISNDTLTLDYQPDQYGSAVITIQGTSNGKTVNDDFQVNVAPQDDAPTVANPIADVNATEDDENTIIDLAPVFTDVDNDDAAITKVLSGNSNSSLVSAVIIGNILTLDYQQDQSGNSTIIIQAASNGKTVNDTFLVAVAPQDDPPTVANEIADVNAAEDTVNTTIDLSTVFTDIDNDDAAIVKSVFNNTNSALVSASITDNTLTLDYQPNQNGTATITVRGTSNGKTVDDDFQVNVAPRDDGPTVANPILDVTVDEDAENTVLDLASVFTDIDNDDLAITKTVLSNSNTTLVAASITTGILTLDYQPEQSGTSTIVIQGASNGKTVTDTFLVTVNIVDDPPFVADAIDDVAVDEDAPSTKIGLGPVFSDVDNDDALITKSVLSNDNETLVLATIFNDTLTLDYQENQSGTATITIRATSNGKTVDDEFDVLVGGVNDPPTVANPIADVNVLEDAENTVIDLTNVFTDVDNDDAAITKTLEGNNNPTLVQATVLGNTLTLDYQENQFGTATIAIRGTSAGQFVDNIFQVNVTEQDDPPTVANPIADITDVQEDAENIQIDLTNVFTDVDNDDGLIAKAIQNNDNETLVLATIAGNVLTLDFQADQNGTANITVRGTSGSLAVDDTFMVAVNAGDDPPTVATAITDVMVLEDAVNTGIDLTNVFTDIDNDDSAITKSVASNTNETLVLATISDNTLTLDYQENQFGSATIAVRGTSNGKTVDDTFNVDVQSVNDVPIITDQIAVVTPEETAVTIMLSQLVVTDVDVEDVYPDDFTLIVEDGENYTRTDQTITPVLNFNGDLSVPVQVSDGSDSSNVFALVVTVNPINDPPVLSTPASLVFNEDDSLIYTIAEIFDWVEDPETPDTSLFFIPLNGESVIVTVDSPLVIIKAIENWFGVDTITIIVSDGELADTSQIELNVHAMNDAPIFTANVPDTLKMYDTADFQQSVANWVTDADPEDNLSWTFELSNENLSYQFASETSTLTLTSNGFLGDAVLRFTVTDDSSASSSDSVVVNVTRDPLSVEELELLIPKSHELSQNYPNPFNPVTHIKFGLPKAQRVMISVFNILGQKVADLIDRQMPAGYHLIDFDASQLSSGIYFYMIRTEDYYKVKKMVLMK